MALVAGVAAGIAAREEAEGDDDQAIFLKPIEDDEPKAWIHSIQAEIFFGGWIVLNAIVLAIECDHKTKANEKDWYWFLLESVFNIVFGIEVVLRVIAEKAEWPLLFWNWMDFVLVLIGVIDTWILWWIDGGADVGFLTLLRVFRLLRLLRLMRVLKVLKSNKELLLLLQGLGAAIRAMLWGMVLLFCINFIFALLFTRVLGKKMFSYFTAEEYYEDAYGTIPRAMFTLFTFTMEFQGDDCRETFGDGAWVTYGLMLYTLITCFALLGTIGSVIVEAILVIAASNHEEEEAEEKEKQEKEALERFVTLYEALDNDGSGALEADDVDLSQASARTLVAKCGVAPQEAHDVFQALKDEKGVVRKDQFVKGMMRLSTDIQARDLLKIDCDIDACNAKLQASLKKQAELLALLDGRMVTREI